MFTDIPPWPFVIPIVAIIMGMGTGIVAIITNYQKRKHMYALHHQERMAAIEKGVDVPPLPEAFFSEDSKVYSPRRNLLKGLIWLFIGLSLLFASPVMGHESTRLGIIPAGIGAAYLIYYFAVGRKEAELADEERRAKLAETNRAARG
jgi:hypothetical protein